ncbi:MAG TPA: murein biosynthesis integral membrane protein MurJ [Vicinamibacterales bacterium]
MSRHDPPSDTPDRQHPGLARSASLAGAATLASRVLGLVREQILAALFGASNEMDAFFVAFRIPNLVRDLFAEGAMSAAFVPTFTRQLTIHGKPAAWRLANNVLNALLVVTLTLVVAGLLFTRPLVTLYAGDYASVPGKLELTIRLTRVMLPYLVTVAVAAVAMGMLNSLHHYFVPAISPAMFNVATIVCAIVLVPVMPAMGLPRIMAIAVAVLFGGLGQILVQWPALRREGFRYSPVIDLRDKALRHVVVLMGPGTIGLAATQINIFVSTLLATSQGTGAVSWLTYAFRLIYLPIGLFGVSIATAALPSVSRHAAVDDLAGIRRTISRGLAMMLMLNVPATLGLIVLARPIVELLYERGRFTAADTGATAAALRLYAVGLVGYSAARIISPTFYALRQSQTAVAVSVATITGNVLFSISLVTWMGFRGLALATSIAALGNGGLLVVLLRRRLKGIEGERLAIVLTKVLVAAATMAIAAWGIEYVMTELLPGRQILLRGVRLVTAIGGGLVVLAVAAKLLRIEEFEDALGLARGNLSKNQEK